MAFNSSAARSSAPQREQGQSPAWKAQGYLNLYLPTKGGKSRKLAAIALKDDKPVEKDLRAWLEKDPSRAAKLLSALTIEYQSATPAEGSGFALDALEAAPTDPAAND